MGEEVTIVTVGVFSLAKADPTEVITLGAAIHWDDSTQRVTADPGTGDDFPKIGAATAGSGNGATTVNVRLDGVSLT